MPDPSKLKVGDRVKLLAVPDADLAQRERELAEGQLDDPGITADTIERIIAQDPVVTISMIDEYGQPWFEYLIQTSGDPEEHWLAVMDGDSWEKL